MSSGGGYVAPAKPAAKTVTAAQQAANEAAATSAKNLKNEVKSSGSSILTSGAGVLDDTDLRRNLLGASAYKAGNTSLG